MTKKTTFQLKARKGENTCGFSKNRDKTHKKERYRDLS